MNIICDVIIPIYNAHDATVNCIDSVIKNTDLTKNRLVLVNDCSPDKRISQHINNIKREFSHLNIEVIENEVNKGFVGTVNVGMKLSNNDVLLLNSDTIVGKEWLDKIKKCAYSQPKVGTVTAMSNNATLVSVPKGLMPNEIPQDISIDEYNDILSECAFCDYPELPTAHGFCMYIRREVLDKIGYFDEKSFGRGYGEENDFSYRCLEYGYKNLLCDNVIVYHLENQSFSEERNKVLDKHLQIIQNRYPNYYNNVHIWCHAFPISHICKNIDLNLELRKKKNVLFLIHEWDNVIGGTTIHVKDIIRSLAKKYNFHVLFPSNSNYVLESHFEEKIVRTTIPFNGYAFMRYNRYSSEYNAMLDKVVKAFAIDIIHVHHIIGHYFDVLDVAQKNNIYSMITLHDFYSLCPSINMLFCNEKYCGDIENKDCYKCLIQTGRASNDIIAEWRLDWKNFLDGFNKIIVPSEDTKGIISKVYNNIEITAIEHGVDSVVIDNKPKIDGKIKVAFIGVICHHKGGDLIKKIVNSASNHNIEFHVFGKSEYNELTQNKENYIFHGPYKRENLKDLLYENGINIICFLQIWPETYSYTVNEAVSSCVPVISLNIGAGAERVKKYNLGWILPKNSSEKDLYDLIESIANDPKKYDEMVDSVYNYNFKTLEEMGEDYDNIYTLSEPKSVNATLLKEIITDETNISVSYNPNMFAEHMLNEILSSAKWRLVSKIKVPKIISRPLKAILRRVKRLIKG